VRGLHLIRIAGIDIVVDWSLLIIFLLIVWGLAAGVFPQWHPAWSPMTAWLTAVAAALLFFASVLAHELSHSLVARAYGIRVRRIMLYVFGGMAQIEHEPGRWVAELWMAIVGPITSLVIGFLCLFLGIVGIRHVDVDSIASVEHALAGLDPARTLLMWLGQINIILALFNLVPAFPLDGGRVLRAILWGVTHDLRRATRWASALGQAFAWFLIGAGIAMALGFSIPILGSGLINGIWLAFIGWFLNNAALVSYRQLLTQETLQDVPVERVMLTRFEVVPPQLPLETLVEAYMQRSDQRAYPVVGTDDRLLGMVFQHDIERLSPEQRRTLTARDVLHAPEQIVGARPDEDVLEVLNVLAQRDINQVPVLENGRVVGLVRRADILRWLALHGSPAGAKPVRS
jgi:Zn-dependent protease/CBS domain-containing protein